MLFWRLRNGISFHLFRFGFLDFFLGALPPGNSESAAHLCQSDGHQLRQPVCQAEFDSAPTIQTLTNFAAVGGGAGGHSYWPRPGSPSGLRRGDVVSDELAGLTAIGGRPGVILVR